MKPSRLFLAPALTLLQVAAVQAATFADDFSSGINPVNWMVQTTEMLYLLDTSQENLSLSMPGGGSLAANHVQLLCRFRARGNFDVHVDFTNASLALGGTSGANQVELDASIGSQFLALSRDDEPSPGQTVHVWLNPPGQGYNYQPTTATYGTLRLTRSGITVSAYFNSTLVYEADFNSDEATFRLMLQNYYTTDPISVTFMNFSLTADQLIPPQAFADGFCSGISPSYWAVQSNQPLYSMTMNNCGVVFSKPAGTGTNPNFQFIALALQPLRVQGDFDVRVGFTGASINHLTGSPGNQVQLNCNFGGQFFAVVRSDESGFGQNVHVYADPPGLWYGTRTDMDTSGILRITRSGTLLSGYFNSMPLYQADYSTGDATLTCSLQNNGTSDPTSVTFQDFQLFATRITPVSLFIRAAGPGQVALSWPDWAPNALLQSIGNLGNPASWQTVTTVPTALPGWFVVTEATQNAAQFYRLLIQ